MSHDATTRNAVATRNDANTRNESDGETMHGDLR